MWVCFQAREHFLEFCFQKIGRFGFTGCFLGPFLEYSEAFLELMIYQLNFLNQMDLTTSIYKFASFGGLNLQ